MNKVELQKQIQYRLSMLSTENKHHEFEELCRHIAKEKVCNNIVPATGPVSSGGDQGRDFESYRNFIDNTNFDGTRCFLGSHTNNQKLVFACTLQKQNIKSKIKADLTSITDGYTEPCSVYFFSEASVSVAARHDIQSWANENYNIEIEIFDSLAISDFLTEERLFWVASHFLDIAHEFYPECIDDDPEYSDLKEKWITNSLTPYNYSDFHEISSALRISSNSEERIVDLEHWIEKLQYFEGNDYPTEVSRHAIFEIVVATLKGRKDLNQQISRLNIFFAGINRNNSIKELEFANSLLIYTAAAVGNGMLDFNTNVLNALKKQFEDILDELLKASLTPDARCRLSLLRGLTLTWRYENENPTPPQISKLLPWVDQIINLAPQAPLFPLNQLSKIMTTAAEFIEEDCIESYEELTPKLDDLISQRVGKRATAENAVNRALKFFQNERYCLAIRELHRAKVDWFTNESINYSIKSMMMLSECYSKLKLYYPSIYYSTAAAFVSMDHESDETTTNIFGALVRTSYSRCALGEWLSFLRLAQSAITAHNMYDPNPLDTTQNTQLAEYVAQIVLIVSSSYRIDETIGLEAHRLFNEIPFDREFHSELNSAIDERKTFWANMSDEEFSDQLSSQFYAHPFSDLGRKRTIKWKALGVAWSVSFDNNSKKILAAEELVYSLQIIQADIAGHDFLLLPSSISISISDAEGLEFLVDEKPSNSGEIWEVSIPLSKLTDRENYQEFFSNIIGLSLSMLVKISLAKQNSIIQKFDHIFSQGIAQKVHFVGSYYGLQTWLCGNDQDPSEPRNLSNPEEFYEFDKEEHYDLRWIDTLGPTYSTEKATEVISNRYRRSIVSIRFSLPALMQDKNFSNLMSSLKDDGWLDWQLLNLVAVVAMNYRNKLMMQNIRTKSEADQAKKVMTKIIDRPEEPSDKLLPASLFEDSEQIEMYKTMTLLPTLQTWDLELKQTTPDISAIKLFMDTRYNASKDDVEHENYFG